MLLQHLRVIFKNLAVYQLSNVILRNPSPFELEFHFCDRLCRRLSLDSSQVSEVGICKSLRQLETIAFSQTRTIKDELRSLKKLDRGKKVIKPLLQKVYPWDRKRAFFVRDEERRDQRSGTCGTMESPSSFSCCSSTSEPSRFLSVI